MTALPGKGDDPGDATPDTQPRSVFADPRHRRWRVVRLAMWTLAITLIGWVATFSAGVYYVGKLPQVSLAPQGKAPEPGVDPLFPAGTTSVSVAPGQGTGGPVVPVDGVPGPVHVPVFGHLPITLDIAFPRLIERRQSLDAALVEWFDVSASAGTIGPIDPRIDLHAAIRPARAEGARLARVYAVAQMDLAGADPTRRAALADAARRAALVSAMAAAAADGDLAGLCLEPTGVEPGDLADLTLFMADLSVAFRALGRDLCLVVPAGEVLSGARDAAAPADFVVLRAFRDPGRGSRSEALAPQAWFAATVAAAVRDFGAERLVVGLGAHARSWGPAGQVPETLSYAEAMFRLNRSGGTVGFAEDTLNSFITLGGADSARRRIELLDALSFHNQLAVLTAYRLRGVAVWSLGLEDPGVWQILGPGEGSIPDRLRAIDLSDSVAFEGEGSFRRMVDPARPGERQVAMSPETGLLTGQTYLRLPLPPVVGRFGKGAPDMVAITFDDGPDARFTGQLLDELRRLDAPAAFFVVGSNILRHPEVLRRIVDEGHEVGSHTFYHPETAAVSETRLRLELNALNRLVAGVTGRSTILFRTPYGSGYGPVSGAEVVPLGWIDAAGYIVVGSEIVPPDWTGMAPEAIVDFVRDSLRRTGGNVIVLHDSGGDRSATVAALPALVQALRADGYRIVPLAELLGTTRDALMPPEVGPGTVFDGLSFRVIALVGPVLTYVFWVVLILGLTRSVVILILALLRRPPPEVGTGYTPTVAVVIPAYNEEVVILDCIRATLATNYPDLRVIVVDDGSTDHTFDKVSAAFRDDPRVLLLHEENRGKWHALDFAYGRIGAEIVVAIDADSLLAPDAIRRLVAPFIDPAVGAVAGSVRVGNPRGLLQRFQMIEYVTAQNIDRRAAELLDAMIVVPGAIGAWRAETVRKAGLYSGDTLTEDADLTVAVHRAGYRVVFVKEAVSVTEVPETLSAYFRQRLRWTFGMMQTGWKHRGTLREGRAVGLFAIADLWLFGVGLSLLAPVADLIFLSVAFDALVNLGLGQPALADPGRQWVLIGYLALPAFDVLNALIAFRLDRREPLWPVLLVPFARLVYRPLQYITVWRAVFRAVSGQIASWGKLARRGALRLPGE